MMPYYVPLFVKIGLKQIKIRNDSAKSKSHSMKNLI